MYNVESRRLPLFLSTRESADKNLHFSRVFLNIEPQLFNTSLFVYVISCLYILAATRYLVKKWS